MLKIGFVTSRTTPSVYIYRYKSEVIWVGNFTDDGEYFCNSKPLILWFQKKMKQAPFTVTFKGRTDYIVGCEIVQNDRADTTTFRMTNKCIEMAQKFAVDKYNELDTNITEIIDKSQCPTDEPTKTMMSKMPYRALLGTTGWIVLNDAPYATYAQNRLASVAHNPSMTHLKALRKHAAFLYQNRDLGVTAHGPRSAHWNGQTVLDQMRLLHFVTQTTGPN